MTGLVKQRIIDFVAGKAGLAAESLSGETQLRRDLGIDGDDAAELLHEFATSFEVDMSEFHFSKHFRSEPHLFSVLSLLIPWKKPAPKEPVTLIDLIKSAESGVWQHRVPSQR